MKLVPLRTMCVQASAITRQTKRLQINNFIVHISEGSSVRNSKPIVVLFGWLMAKDKHFSRLYDYYLSRNIDVLRVQVSPATIFIPHKSKPVTADVLNYLSEEDHNDKPLLVHGFSGGGYMYGDIVAVVLQNPEKYGNFKNRILGHVSDSALELESATRGISVSVTKSKPLQKVIKRTLDKYIEMYPQQVSHIRKNNDIYVENPLRIPTLYIHSHGDKIADEECRKMPLMIAEHLKDNIPSFYHEFDTPHVQHFRHYPEKYAELLDDFIDYIKIKN